MADWFARAFGGAVEDIRAELIDRAWFGRNPRPAQPGSDDKAPAEHEEPGHADPTHDHEIDR